MLVKDQILWLDISMQNTIRVQELQTKNHARHKELGLFLSESPVFTYMVSQVSSLHKIND